jgi:hypothetical protein
MRDGSLGTTGSVSSSSVFLGSGEEPRQRFEIVRLGEEQDAIACSQLERAAGAGCHPVSDDERDPGMLTEWQVADRAPGRSR